MKTYAKTLMLSAMLFAGMLMCGNASAQHRGATSGSTSKNTSSSATTSKASSSKDESVKEAPAARSTSSVTPPATSNASTSHRGASSGSSSTSDNRRGGGTTSASGSTSSGKARTTDEATVKNWPSDATNSAATSSGRATGGYNNTSSASASSSYSGHGGNNGSGNASGSNDNGRSPGGTSSGSSSSSGTVTNKGGSSSNSTSGRNYNNGNGRRPGTSDNSHTYNGDRRGDGGHNGGYNGHADNTRFEWNYTHSNWSRPVAPPTRNYRPEPLRRYVRPTVPSGYTVYVSAPAITSILGIGFGTYYDNSLNHLYMMGYEIDGFMDGVIYLRDVPLMRYTWPDVMLSYDSYGRFEGAQFVYSTAYTDRGRFNRLYHELYANYGTPVYSYMGSNRAEVTWYGGGMRGYVTLTIETNYGRCYTTITIGS